MLAPGEGCRATQHREGSNLVFQHWCIQKVQLGIPQSREAILVNGLTKLDYLANLLVGVTFFFWLKKNLHLWAVMSESLAAQLFLSKLNNKKRGKIKTYALDCRLMALIFQSRVRRQGRSTGNTQ